MMTTEVHRVNPHLLERGDGVITVPADPAEALLILPSADAADRFSAAMDAQPRAVTSEEITEACEQRGIHLLGLYNFVESEDLSIVQAEWVEEIFEEIASGDE